MKTTQHSALINSSFTALFVLFTFAWAYVYSWYFPQTLKWQAFFLLAAFSLMIYVFRFLLIQFHDGVTVLRLIVLYFCLSALMTFLSAVRGPLAEGTIPVIQILFFGPYIYSSAHSSYIIASIFPFYGAVTLVSSLLTSTLVEFVYSKTYTRLPKAFTQKLRAVDTQIDKASVAKSDRWFFLDEWKGMLAAVILLSGYVVLYSLILIF